MIAITQRILRSSLKRIAASIVTIALMAYLVHRNHDPLRAALPFGTTDLSSVEADLQRLQPEDRVLVEAYVKRSNGDVLLPCCSPHCRPRNGRPT